MAPEDICKMNHSFPVDYFALGVMAYEFMTGKVTTLLFSDLIWAQTENRFVRRY